MTIIFRNSVMLNNIDALSTKSVMVVEMIASRLSSVITG